MRSIGMFVAAAALLGACAVPGPREAERYFILEAAGAASAPRHAVSAQVAPTTAASFYDTQDIAFSRAPGERAYYQFSRWTERPQRSVQRQLAARLEGGAARSALRLDTNVDEIYHDAATPPGTARITVSAELSDSASRAVIARRTFTRSSPAASFDAPGAVRGFHEALAGIVADIEAWVAGEAPKAR